MTEDQERLAAQRKEIKRGLYDLFAYGGAAMVGVSFWLISYIEPKPIQQLAELIMLGSFFVFAMFVPSIVERMSGKVYGDDA